MKRTRKRRRFGLASASQAIGGVLGHYKIDRELREHRILVHWNQIVGDKVAQHTIPDGLDKGVLWVRVSSSSWMHQLSFLRAEMMAKANELCGQELVREVRLHLGGRRENPDDAIAAAVRIRRAPVRERPLPPPAQGQRLAQIESEAAGIEDEELRAAIVEVRRRLDL